MPMVRLHGSKKHLVNELNLMAYSSSDSKGNRSGEKDRDHWFENEGSARKDKRFGGIHKYTVDDIDNIVSESPNGKSKCADPANSVNMHQVIIGKPDDEHIQSVDARTDMDGDIPMQDMDDEIKVDSVSRYVSDRRAVNTESQDFSMHLSQEIYDDQMELDNVTEGRITAFVVDTNFIISHLNTLELLRSLSTQFHHQIVIPRTVIYELDGLKNSTKEVSGTFCRGKEDKQVIGVLARRANDWIYKNLANLDSGVVGQKIKQRLDFSSIKDDSILDCCLYFRDKLNRFVILLSNDKNLCLKALTERLLTVSYRKGMSAELIASKAFEENQEMQEHHLCDVNFEPPNEHPETKSIQDRQHSHKQSSQARLRVNTFHDASLTIFNEIQSVVLSAIDHIMTEEYGEDLEFIGYHKQDTKDLSGACRCLYKFWLSVFTEYFKGSKFQRNDWKSPPCSLVESPSNPANLNGLVEFWTHALDNLYLKREKHQTESLHVLFDRWVHGARQWLD